MDLLGGLGLKETSKLGCRSKEDIWEHSVIYKENDYRRIFV